MDQRELSILNRVEIPRRVDDALLSTFKSGLQAFQATMLLAGLNDVDIYEALGIDKGQFSRIRTGNAHLAFNKRVAFFQRCNNVAALQWEARELGYELIPLNEQRIAEAERLEALAARLRAESQERRIA